MTILRNVGVILAAGIAFAAGQPGLPEPGLRALGNGQWEATAEVWVDASDQVNVEDPPCTKAPNDEIQKALAAVAVAATTNPYLKVVAGPIAGALAGELAKAAEKSGGTIGLLISPNRSARCAVVAIKIPNGSVVNGYKYLAGDGDKGVSPCPTDGHGWPVCTCGWCRWEPAMQGTDAVAAVFKNWKHDRARWGSLTVTFTPPPGVTPQSPK